MTTWALQNKTSSSFSNISQTTNGQVTATAGLYQGFGCLTYAGGEILVAGTLASWSQSSKTSSSFTNINKS